MASRTSQRRTVALERERQGWEFATVRAFRKFINATRSLLCVKQRTFRVLIQDVNEKPRDVVI